jgi:hypothetical protein
MFPFLPFSLESGRFNTKELQDKETKMAPLEFCYLVSLYKFRALDKDLYNVPL